MNVSLRWKKRFVYTNLTGLSNIARAESIIHQIIWFLICTASTLFTAYLVIESVIHFMKCQVSTTVRRTTLTKLDFPKITFCNQNPLNSDFLLDLYNKAHAKKNITLETTQYYLLLQLESYMKNTSGRYLTEAEKLNMSDLDGMLISCMFRNKPCNLKDDFISVFDASFLSCISFNSGLDSLGRSIGAKKVFSSNDELSLEFYVGLPNEITSFYPNKGMLVWIYDFSSNYIRLHDNPFLITAGFDATVRASPFVYKQFNQWPYVYSDCTVGEDNTLLKPLVDTNIFDYLRVKNIKYTQESCINVCFQQVLAEKCGCIDFWLNVTIPGYDYCLDEKANCSHDFYFKVFVLKSFVSKNCIDNCPAECVTRGNHFELSYQKYPQLAYAKTLKSNDLLISKYANQTDFRHNLDKSVQKVSIRYDSLSYKETIEEPQKSWTSFIGELGGYLHIFLGMSLISFIDIFEFFGLFASEQLRR